MSRVASTPRYLDCNSLVVCLINNSMEFYDCPHGSLEAAGNEGKPQSELLVP